MMLYFAMVTDGDFQRAAFFDLRIFPQDGLPPGAVRITPEKYAALLAGQAAGQIICADAKGRPRLTNPVPTRPALLLAIKQESGRRILAISPAWQQTNDLRALLAGDPAPAAEARFAAIDAVRAASDLIEQQLAATPDRALPAFPIAENPLWPVFGPADQTEQDPA